MLSKFQEFIIIALLFISCDSAEPGLEPIPPTNLIVDISVDESNPMNINITAIAENANYYTIDLDDGSEQIREDDGTYTYTYSDAGEYTVTVNAHTTDEVFISDSKNVSIQLADNSGVDDEGYSTPTSYDGYDLIWADEFDRSDLGGDWTYEIGTGNSGWGNNELQYYKEENTELIDGYLVITAKEENSNGREYTSSRIITENNQEFQFGRIDIRAILPTGQGIWPALWMLGSNFRDVGWPSCGEIDIMEKIGGGLNDKEVFGTLHWDINGDYACTCGQGEHYQLSEGDFGDKFHVFTLLWDESKIQWLVDDNLYHTIDISPSHMDEFRDKFFFIFNVAVGGNLPGSPDASTVFPQKMVVDYVRVFQQQ